MLDLGHGQPVVCLHGVPASSFLYRKLIVELAARSFRGIAFDLPGLGLAERPAAFDYTWTGLGRSHPPRSKPSTWIGSIWWCTISVGRCPELAAAHPGRIASLTVLNAPVEVDTFHRPWVMKPFAVKGLGEAYLLLLNQPTFRWLLRHQVLPTSARSRPLSLDAYLVLLRCTDNGRAFEDHGGFEHRAKRDSTSACSAGRAFPVQIIWEADPALKVTTFGGDRSPSRRRGPHPPATRQTFPAGRSVAGAGRVDHRAGPAVMSRRNQASAWPRLIRGIRDFHAQVRQLSRRS